MSFGEKAFCARHLLPVMCCAGLALEVASKSGVKKVGWGGWLHSSRVVPVSNCTDFRLWTNHINNKKLFH